jgi:hypothetical protein
MKNNEVVASRDFLGCSHDIGFYIKKIIWSFKKFVYNLFGWKMDIAALNELPPTVIINSVLYAAHKEYSNKRKKVTKTKAVKLVIKSIEAINYHKISYGCYKYGEYSFDLHNILSDIFGPRSLHGIQVDKELINFEVVELIKPTIVQLKPIMTGTWKRFIKWAHQDQIPLEYKSLYDCHDTFSIEVGKMIDCQKPQIGNFYDIFSNLISEFDSNLKHVDQERVHFYFDYMDLFEGFLLVCKNRDTNFRQVKNILNDFKRIYDDDVASLIFPYDLTLKNENIVFERAKYKENLAKKETHFLVAFQELKSRAIKFNLIPTIEDMDFEIEREMKTLDQEEKKELHRILAS